MANAYSTPINYGQTVPTTDLAQYVGAIQKGMQQKFDINLAKIDDLISKVATVPLARDKDKRYLGDKLQGLLSMVDANSKVDLSDNVVARQISAYVTTAIDDNVKEQLANSQKISNYQQTAAQRKKDKPELYSDANYAYGLDKSGYQDYINEKTDSLGTMDYIDNYDVDKNLTKELEAFAKERGFEKVLDESVEGGYIYQTVKGKQLTEEEIGNFFDNKIATDPKLKQQFMINSHYNHRGVSDEDLIKSYKEQSEPILKDFDTKITNIDEKLKNVSADDKATADLLHRQKSEMQQQKSNFSSQLDTKNFNRDSFLYDNYARSMKKSYTNTYAYAAITDISRDDFLLKIATAKGEAGTSTTGTIPGSEGLSAGTRFQINEPEPGKVKEEPNYLEAFNKDRESSWADLQGIIKERLVEEGKQPTVANVTSYYTALKTAIKDGVNLNAIKGYDTQVLDAFTKVVDVNKTSYRLSKEAKNTYGKATNEILTGLFGGKEKNLYPEGLAITAPVTAELLKKYKNVSQIPKKEKAIALYELASNLKENVLDDDKDKANINFYLQALKKENNISDKELAKRKPEESGRFWGGLGEVFQGIGQLAWNTVPATIASTIAGMGDSSGEDIQKGYDEDAAARGRAMDKMERGSKDYWKGLIRAVTEDTDLSEIESGDIKLGKYQGVKDLMTDISSTTNSRFDEILSKRAKRETGDFAIVLNPAIKRDEPTVNAINSAIINAITMGEDGIPNAGPPVKDTAIKVSNITNGFAKVTYTQEIDVPSASGKGTKKGQSQNTIDIPLKNLPQELIKNLETQVGSWAYSGKNESGMKQTISYSPPKDLDSRYNFTQNYVKNYGPTLSQENISRIQTEGLEDVKTKEDYKKAIDRALPPEYAKEFTDKYLNSDYKVEWERPEGAGAGFIGHLMQDGKRIKTIRSDVADYNQTTYTVYTMKLVNQHLESVITDYRSKALRLRN
jgi:hypothetical protein